MPRFSIIATGVLLMTITVPESDAGASQAPSSIPSSSGATDRPAGPPPEMMKALADHVASLTAMCPPQPVLDAASAAQLPIHETVWGSAGPEVLLVHGGVQGGLGGGPRTFDKQQALADHGWQVRRVDRPGFGSSPSRGPDDMQEDAVWIADRLTPGVSLIGHSWGGAEALLAAARRPNAIRSLVLVEPALELLASTDPSFVADPIVRAATMKRFAGWMASRTPAEYGQAFRDSLGATASDPTTTSATPEERQAAATRVGCAFLRSKMAPIPVMQQAVATIVEAGIPVLVISGGWSRSFDLTSEIVARQLHGRHVIVASPNHFVQQENAPEFNKVVAAFMASAPVRR